MGNGNVYYLFVTIEVNKFVHRDKCARSNSQQTVTPLQPNLFKSVHLRAPNSHNSEFRTLNITNIAYCDPRSMKPAWQQPTQ